MKRLNQAISLVECLGHFDGIVPSLPYILMKQHGVRSGKYSVPLENLWKGHFQDSKINFKLFLGTSALKNLCLCVSSKAAYYSLSAWY